MPPASWYAAWLAALRSGNTPEEAVAGANASCRTQGKMFARCLIRGGAGKSFLSVGIEGGSHSLGRRVAENRVRLSPHGNWPHVHLGALEAAYGRTPFYPCLAEPLRETLSAPPEKLRDLNTEIHAILSAFLDAEGLLPFLDDANMERAREVAGKIDPELSVVDALMRLGPETLLGLLYMME